MDNDAEILAQSHTAEAVNASAVAYEARQKATQVIFESTLDTGLADLRVSLATLIAGQNATNDHFARLNGSVAEHTKEINTLVIWKATLDGVKMTVNGAWVALLSLGSGILVLLAAHFFKL